MPTNDEYQSRIQSLDWVGLRDLWERIKGRDTPGWDPGRAFEYLVLRMFDLDHGNVRWPYTVSLSGGPVIEEIDGSVQVRGLYCLVESKDEGGNISTAPIAKLRNQLLRRPSGTIGLLFSSREFTEPAAQLSQFNMPQAILLWIGDEVERALEKESIAGYLERKYRACVDEGITDFNITLP
jgi:hypothetical protein